MDIKNMFLSVMYATVTGLISMTTASEAMTDLYRRGTQSKYLVPGTLCVAVHVDKDVNSVLMNHVGRLTITRHLQATIISSQRNSHLEIVYKYQVRLTVDCVDSSQAGYTLTFTWNVLEEKT